MAPPADQSLLDEAVSLAREAGELTLRWFRSAGLAIDRKGDGTPVTEADRAAERLLRQRLADRYPHDGIIGEEEGATEGASGRTWIIDPIDGTKAFTHGVPLYTTLLAVVDADGPLIGVVDVPALGETVWAGRGRGCWCDGKPARVSVRAGLEGAYLTTSGYEDWDEDRLLAVRRAGVVMRGWGDGYGYCLVATGRVEAMVDAEAAAWDLAPMATIITEAGGRFTDLSGEARYDGGSGLATNGLVHDEMLSLFR